MTAEIFKNDVQSWSATAKQKGSFSQKCANSHADDFVRASTASKNEGTVLLLLFLIIKLAHSNTVPGRLFRTNNKETKKQTKQERKDFLHIKSLVVVHRPSKLVVL